MAQAPLQEIPSSGQPMGCMGLVTRLTWLLVGPFVIMVVALLIGQRGEVSALDVTFGGVVFCLILVRYFDAPGLSDKIRITIGTSQENNALLGGIKALSTAEKAA